MIPLEILATFTIDGRPHRIVHTDAIRWLKGMGRKPSHPYILLDDQDTILRGVSQVELDYARQRARKHNTFTGTNDSSPCALINQKWDPCSGLRERLALLAQVGPVLDPATWAYTPRTNEWQYLGGALTIQGCVRVSAIAPPEESLLTLNDSWRIDRDQATDLIWGEDEEKIRATGAVT